jgi:hypothetical protein
MHRMNRFPCHLILYRRIYDHTLLCYYSSAFRLASSLFRKGQPIVLLAPWDVQQAHVIAVSQRTVCIVLHAR